MFLTTLPVLPPPSTSLLPPLQAPAADPQSQQHGHPHAQHRRPKRTSTSYLSALALDERTIQQRKMAIAMYGYSWLRPAGCTRTMLGRREEEIEREEVERQLREVEMQERHAQEAEEAERNEMLRRQGEGGDLEGQGDEERDLDEDVPEASDGEDREEDELEGEEEEDMGGDLDDEIPDGDAGESSWVYDTGRGEDTESDEGLNERLGVTDDIEQSQLQSSHSRGIHSAYLGVDDAAETEAMVNAMLDEDELGEVEQHDLDEDILDMDANLDVDMDEDLEDRDLDEDVPEPENEDEWQHTDTELEESEMDISILPPGLNQPSLPPNSVSSIQRRRGARVGPGTTHEEMRRSSGNMRIPPPPAHNQASSPGQMLPPANIPRHATRYNVTPQYQTAGQFDSVSNLISTDGSYDLRSQRDFQTRADLIEVGSTTQEAEPEDNAHSPRRDRSWLNPAGARRNLFGGFRGGMVSNATAATTAQQSNTAGIDVNPASDLLTRQQDRSAVSSGGLFTPSPGRPMTRTRTGAQILQSQGQPSSFDTPEEPRSRTRSGRLLGGMGSIQIGRRRGRRDEET